MIDDRREFVPHVTTVVVPYYTHITPAARFVGRVADCFVDAITRYGDPATLALPRPIHTLPTPPLHYLTTTTLVTIWMR